MEGPQVIAGRSEIGEETEIMDEHEADIRAGSISKCWSCCARRNQVASHPLKSAFEQRIEELGLLLSGSIIESLAINVAAVLEGHKLGDSLWLDGQYYVCFC